jgi:DNA-binding NtrC family response regulator
MTTELRRSGVAAVGDLPWGSHLCQFYETRDDLLEVLVPYFKAGLESNEACVWIVSTLTEQDASNALRRAVPEVDRYLADHGLEIFRDSEWYTSGGSFDPGKVGAAWREKLEQALASGHAGMRVTGDVSWLRRAQWRDFNAYEDELNRSIVDLKMLCVCSYPLSANAPADVLDVTRTHRFTMARPKREWELVETAELKQARSELTKLNEELEQRVLENSPAIREVIERIDMVAPTDASVLILGETGVGKELVARSIHARSPRRDFPLVTVNCTAIPRDLFESEFFGHVKGAFSGAFKDRVGRFQRADGGTLFLDEVGDLPLEMQPKLLRVLQDGEFEAVGDDKPRRTDCRVIAASNQDLRAAVRAGRFRQDLYYRLSVFPIQVPPLRERKEDIPILADHFLKVACKRFKLPNLRLTEDQIDLLQQYDWPGNVRELQNVVKGAVIAARGNELHLDIPEVGAESVAWQAPDAADDGAPNTVVLEADMRRLERENVVVALKLSHGRIYGAGGAAELLGVKPSTLSTRIRKLGIKKNR